MNAISRDRLTGDICKNHSSKIEREVYHSNTSNLTKSELEDLYYDLLQNNQDLKLTVNNQKEKLKLLTTKILRISAVHRNNLSKEPQNKCCITYRAVINEQNEIIQDLKNVNMRLSESVRRLNVRLCSAKQFLKTSSNKCSRCAINRKSTSTILNMKASEVNMQRSAVTTQRTISEKVDSVRSDLSGTDNNYETEISEKTNHEKKYKTLIEEQKQKILDLEKNLKEAHAEYTSHIVSIKKTIDKLQSDNVALRAECKYREEDTEQKRNEARHIASRLREAEAVIDELETNLSIERKKVAEMETHMKSLELTKEVVNIIEEHLCYQMASSDVGSDANRPIHCQACNKVVLSFGENIEDQRNHDTGTDKNPDESNSKDILLKHDISKNFDDSGFLEARSSDGSFNSVLKINEELKRKVLLLEAELDLFKVIAAGEGILESRTKSIPTLETKDSSNIEKSISSKMVNDDEQVVSDEINQQVDSCCHAPKETTDNVMENLSKDKKIDLIKERTKSNEEVITSNVPKTVLKEGTMQHLQSSYYKNVEVKCIKSVTSKRKRGSSDDSIRSQSNIDRRLQKKHQSRRNMCEVKLSDGVLNEEIRKSAKMKENENSVKPLPRELQQQNESKFKLSEAKKNTTNILLSDSNGNVPRARDKNFKRVSISKSSIKNVTNSGEISGKKYDKVKANERQTEGDISEAASDHHIEDHKSSSHSLHNKTYSIHSKEDIGDRATSPDNTENDVSSISESNSLKCKRSPSEPLSLGEDRGTLSDTYTSTGPISSSEHGYLSEGEIPIGPKLSVGEKVVKKNNGGMKPSVLKLKSKSDEMDAALRSITQELTRCRQLLLTKRPQK